MIDIFQFMHFMQLKSWILCIEKVYLFNRGIIGDGRGCTYALVHGIQKLEHATSTTPFAGRVICGSCDQVFGRKVWNSTDKRLPRSVRLIGLN